ncbi:unnamed protein product [Spirodela intermedia]|uniref:C2H2-type domain-containing protein n=1 Tax=Spirodela intermedia TaxID=51605 RepID=A0A7I8IG84_SPIIN|nr:unnamed protein product [Spirodela intermedia]CAA6656791.1 unnamed protein product [Spirodela intermedia]
MEEGRCRRLTGGSRVGDLAGGAATAAFYDEYSLEEDSAGQGYPWPPRSYSCSFCRREFRSAQALGGHVNVHRRDRARLKLSSATQIEIGLRQIPCPPGVSVGTSRSPSSSSFRVSGTSPLKALKSRSLSLLPAFHISSTKTQMNLQFRFQWGRVISRRRRQVAKGGNTT